jgi:hypothetical protein
MESEESNMSVEDHEDDMGDNFLGNFGLVAEDEFAVPQAMEKTMGVQRMYLAPSMGAILASSFDEGGNDVPSCEFHPLCSYHFYQLLHHLQWP